MVPVYMEMRSDEKILQKQETHLIFIGLAFVFLLGIFRYIDLNSRFPKAPTRHTDWESGCRQGKRKRCAVEAKILKGRKWRNIMKKSSAGKK